MWKDVFIEDIKILEVMRIERVASSYDGGKFSTVMDFTTHHLHEWKAQHMLQTGSDDGLIILEQLGN